MEYIVVYLSVQFTYKSCRPDSTCIQFCAHVYCPEGLTWLVSLKRDLGGCRLTPGSHLLKNINKLRPVLFRYHWILARYLGVKFSSLDAGILLFQDQVSFTRSHDRCPFCFVQKLLCSGWRIHRHQQVSFFAREGDGIRGFASGTHPYPKSPGATSIAPTGVTAQLGSSAKVLLCEDHELEAQKHKYGEFQLLPS